MNTVLVTIVGPEGRTDAAAPADTPLRELVPTFAQLTGTIGSDASGWDVGPPGRSPLLANSSLGDQGIVDGSVLHLRPRGAASPVLELAPPPERLRPDDSSPVRRTRDTLPEWLGVGGRLRAARGAEGGLRAGWRTTSYERRLEESIRARRLSRPVTIAVVSPAGGAGRSTIATLLGMLLAQLRVDRTILLDTAPVSGFGPRHNVAVDSLLDPEVALDPWLVPANDGLTLLPVAAGADPGAYERVVERLREAAGLVIVDCGAGFDDPAARAALGAADQLVVVVDAGPAGREDVACAAAALGEGTPPAVLVVNRIPARGQDVAWLEHEMPAARGLIAVHSDPRRAARLAAGQLTWSERMGPWDEPLRELAAMLASEWVRLGLVARR